MTIAQHWSRTVLKFYLHCKILFCAYITIMIRYPPDKGAWAQWWCGLRQRRWCWINLAPELIQCLVLAVCTGPMLILCFLAYTERTPALCLSEHNNYASFTSFTCFFPYTTCFVIIMVLNTWSIKTIPFAAKYDIRGDHRLITCTTVSPGVMDLIYGTQNNLTSNCVYYLLAHHVHEP